MSLSFIISGATYYCEGRCDDVERSCKTLFRGVLDYIPAIEFSKLGPRIG